MKSTFIPLKNNVFGKDGRTSSNRLQNLRQYRMYKPCTFKDKLDGFRSTPTYFDTFKDNLDGFRSTLTYFGNFDSAMVQFLK